MIGSGPGDLELVALLKLHSTMQVNLWVFGTTDILSTSEYSWKFLKLLEDYTS